MSTEIMNYDEEFKKIAEQTRHALTTAKINFISTKGKLFTLLDGTTTPKIACIIVDFIRINSLMPPYNPNVRTNPKCWAFGRDDSTLAPSPNSPAIQAPTCADCAQNKYGSAQNGGRGKACANTYRIAVVPPDATIDSDIAMIKISPTGLDRWRRYVNQTETAFGAGGFCKVVTQISFDPNRDYPSLIFSAIERIKHPEVILALCKRAQEEILVEPNRD